MPHHKVELSLLGKNFAVITDDNPEDVLAAAKVVQDQMEELRALGTTAGTDRLLTLVALNLAGKLLRKDQSDVQNIEHIISSLDSLKLQAESLAKVPLR